jgi:type VI secretion system protein ImpL
VETLLSESRLYTVKEGILAWWNGKPPLAFLAFDVRNDTELAAYVSAQRQRLSTLARAYAAPLVAFLQGLPTTHDRDLADLLTKWDTIGTELDAYDRKTPENSVALLEQFIRTMNDLTKAQCLPDKAAPTLTRQGTDYFLQQRDALRHAVDTQYQVLMPQMARALYQDIATHFTEHLAGRFPFAELAPGTSAQEATPTAIRTFYQVFAASAPTLLTILKHSDMFGNAGTDVHAFLQQLAEIRRFFASFLDEAGGLRVPVFDLQVAFRVNRQREQGADQIIEWRFTMGDQRLHYRGPQTPSQGRWGFGDPIQLALRWAKDAPSLPLATLDPVEGRVADRTIVYTDTSRWPLLRFLQRHTGAPRDFDQLVDPELHTLALTITTGPAKGQKTLHGDDEAATAPTKVFIRVTVLSADKQEHLVVPPFPTHAPSLPMHKDLQN